MLKLTLKDGTEVKYTKKMVVDNFYPVITENLILQVGDESIDFHIK